MAEPKYLLGYRAICAECKIGYETFKEWLQKGAPIHETRKNGKPRYRAEKHKLMAWVMKMDE